MAEKRAPEDEVSALRDQAVRPEAGGVSCEQPAAEERRSIVTERHCVGASDRILGALTE